MFCTPGICHHFTPLLFCWTITAPPPAQEVAQEIPHDPCGGKSAQKYLGIWQSTALCSRVHLLFNGNCLNLFIFPSFSVLLCALGWSLLCYIYFSLPRLSLWLWFKLSPIRHSGRPSCSGDGLGMGFGGCLSFFPSITAHLCLCCVYVLGLHKT